MRVDNVQPSRGKYLIEVLSDHIVTQSGIVLAKITREIGHRGTIIAIGSPSIKKGKNVSLRAIVGDILHYKKYSGKTFRVDNKEYLFLREDEVVGIETDG